MNHRTPRSLACAALSFVALAAAASAQRLVAVDSSRELSTIDMVTGAKTPVGSILNGIGIGSPSGFAYDPIADLVFFVSSSTDSLYALDLATLTPTLVGAFGDPAIVMQGFELDVGSGQLYGCSSHDGGFYAIDRATGAATLLGSTGLIGSTNLAYEPLSGTMFATNTATDTLYTVDRSTGALTPVGSLQNVSSVQGLAFHPSTGVLYAVDHVADQLFAIDPATGTAWPVGSTGAGNLLGLMFLPGGTGSLVRQPHGCGSAHLFAHGQTRTGGGVTVQLTGTTGVPFVGFGVAPTAIPFCGCTIGHEWALAFAGTTSNVNIPADPALVGVQVGMQGLDLFGTGGCADPAIVLTDTVVLTIG
jgi:hypothetical protein